MGTKLLFIFALSMALAPTLGATEALPVLGENVEDLLALAQQQNPELATAYLEAEAANERTGSAGALPDPNFRVELRDFTNINSGAAPSILPSKVGNTYFRVMQPLPFWGKRGLKHDMAEAEASQAQGQLEATRAELLTKIKIEYAQYYLYTHRVKLTQKELDLTLNLERIAKSRYATGLAPQQDVIRAQVEQTGMRRELVSQKAEQHHSISRLNTMLLRPVNAPLAEPRQLRPIPATEKIESPDLLERLRRKNPQLSIVDSQVAAADINRQLSYKNRYPDFAVGLAPTQVGNEIKEWELMVEFNIPLQQGARRSQERESEKMLAAVHSRKKAVSYRIEGELAEYISALVAAQALESITVSSLLPQAEATLEAAAVGYQSGKVDFATLLDAQRQIIKARQDVLNAQVQAQINLAQIERLMGEEI
jgi:outer membrane protein, heavy metal efflux system